MHVSIRHSCEWLGGEKKNAVLAGKTYAVFFFNETFKKFKAQTSFQKGQKAIYGPHFLPENSALPRVSVKRQGPGHAT